MRCWLICCLSILASVGAAQDTKESLSSQITAPVSELRRLYEENSYQLALEAADKLTTEALPEGARREATYLRSMALMHLNRYGEARKGFQALAREGADDVWAGRAHWRLQPGLPPHGHAFGYDKQTTDQLLHLRKADQLLSRSKPEDLPEFYRAVVYEGLHRLPATTPEQREYVFSFFDRLIGTLTNEEEIAQAHLQKAQNHSYVDQKQDVLSYVRSLRQIVTEFPKTDAAAQAQLLIAQHYIQMNDLIAAVYELSILAQKFPRSEPAKQGEALAREIKQSEVLFTLPGPFLPDEVVSFTLFARNTGDVSITAVSFDPVKTLAEQKRTRYDLKAITGKGKTLKRVEIKSRNDFQPTSATVQFKAPEPGVYVLKAEASGAASYALLLVSKLALVSKSGPTTYQLKVKNSADAKPEADAKIQEFWVVDSVTGKPRGGAEVVVASDVQTQSRWFGTGEQRFFSRWTEVPVNSEGFADYASSTPDGELFVIARDGEHYAFQDNLYWSQQGGDGRSGPLVYFYTDRPVYRPAQKAFWRALVRTRSHGKYAFNAGEKYSVEVMDPRGTRMHFYDGVALSRFGSISGELDIPEAATLGAYSCIVRRLRDNAQIGHGTFRVEEYKKPEYEVQVTAGSELARINEQVEGRISATYYFGAPVADAEVRYTVRRRPRYHIMWDFLGWRPDAGPELDWFEPNPEPRGRMHGSGGDIVAEGTGRTDADGIFKLQFKAEVPPQRAEEDVADWQGYGSRSIWPPRNWRSFDFQIEATVIDKSRRSIDGSETIVVSEKALQLSVRAERQVLSPGDIAQASLNAKNMNGEPVATSGTLYVERLVWNPGTQKDDITTVSSSHIEIGSSGTLIVRWRVPDGETGRMRHLLVVEDPFGGLNTADAGFYVAAPDTKDVHAQYHGVEIIADKNHYQVGDTARLLILNEYTDTSAWYWIDAGSGNLEKRLVSLPHRTNFVNVPITDAFVPNVKVHIVAVRNQRVISDEVELIVPPLRQVINVEVVPNKPKYLPGEQGSVSIRATDHAGNPVEAEFSLSMFDESVLYIVPDMRPDIRRAFYGERRQLHTQLHFSGEVPERYRDTVPDSIGQFLMRRVPADTNRWYFYDEGRIPRRGIATKTAGFSSLAAAMPAAAAPEAAASGQLSGLEVQDTVGNNVEHKSETAKMVEPRMRTDFRDSMFWSPAVVTDAHGEATVQVTYPDSLTTWKCVAVGVTAGSHVGNETTETLVTKNLLARVEAPRFFRERDEVTISGVVHNYLPSEKQVEISLATGPQLRLSPAGETSSSQSQRINIPAGGERRVDWRFQVITAGETSLTLVARSDEESDAVEKSYPVLPHGIDKFVAWNGSSQDQLTSTAANNAGATETLIVQSITIPTERIKGTSVLDITVNPSLAFAIRDALPYMIEYPYGCVEQTMSRFMPAVVAMRTFQDLGISAPPYIDEKLPAVVEAGLQRLSDMQLPDGSWGWWRGDQANLQMTAYVMYGLTLCREADVQVNESVFTRGLHRLQAMITEQHDRIARDRNKTYWYNDGLHGIAYGALVLSMHQRLEPVVLETLWQNRENLSPTGLALLARTLHRVGRSADVPVVIRNLHNFVTRTPENGAAHWGQKGNGWYWWQDSVESTAMALMAHLEADPQNPLVQESMKWLVLNRQGRQWKSTKDTAHAVLALSSYLRTRNEIAADLQVEIWLQPGELSGDTTGTQPIKSITFNRDNFWSFNGQLRLRGDQIPESPTGKYQVIFRKEGPGSMFYAVSAEYFTLEENIARAGNEIYVERVYERLVRQPATTGTLVSASEPEVDTSIVAHDAYVPLKPGELIQSGDELRVTLKIRSLNDYEYLVFEDPKPAGTEPVALQSGTSYAGGLCSNMELRDEHVAFFITRLPQGTHTITYSIRAEVPGVFHTMPTKGYAMYFPPLRANSDELVLKVVDR